MLRLPRFVALSAAAWMVGCGSDTPPTPAPEVDAGSDVAAPSEASPEVEAGRPDTSVESSAANDAAIDTATDTRSEADLDAANEAGDARTGLEQTAPYVTSKIPYPTANPHTPEKATLGKILFWEEQLSSHDKMACGTCHRSAAGGSDPRSSEPLSLGAGPNGVKGDADDVHGGRGVVRCDATGAAKSDPIYGAAAQITARKPPTYLDAMFFDTLFWDGRATDSFKDPVSGAVLIDTHGALESQAAGPPTNDVEMSCENYTWTMIADKLAKVTTKPLALAKNIPADMAKAIADHPTYLDLFQWVYGPREITPAKILFAIATHERTLLSNQTPWDRFNSGDRTALSAPQQRGLALFNLKARCAVCHIPPTFHDNKFHNVGFGDPNLDKGLAVVSTKADDLGKMKTPSLRNVGLRAAGGLMHNGTGNGATLQTVITAYNQGGSSKDHIDIEMKQLDLTQVEFNDLFDFVENGLTDPRVKDEVAPFDRPKLSTE